jgi:SAM-dependent methyltransferase
VSARDVVSKVVSHPRVFAVQSALLGSHRAAEALVPITRRATAGRSSGIVVDVGGGTASGRSLWPQDWTYVSLDPDHRVVEFDTSGGSIQRLVGDASKLGFMDHSIDVVMMKNVSHHLDDATWSGSLAEVQRVLKPDGYFLFIDAVWSRRRLISRLAWTLDAGRFPRAPETLEHAVATSFDVERVERQTLVHHSIMLTTRPISPQRLEPAGRSRS